MFRVLSESDVLAGIGDLAKAWDAADSFLLAPSPCPVPEPWIAETLAKLPAALATGHFGLLTSGSTGAPKLVLGVKTRSARLVDQIHQRQCLGPVACAVLALPLAYSYSLVNQWMWAHLRQRTLLVTRGLAEPARLFTTLTDTGNSMVCLVGSQVPMLRRFLEAGRSFPRVIRVNFAGGPYPQADMPWLAQTFPAAEFYHNYGCTEALPRLTIRPAAEFSDPMILGRPVDGIELSLGDDGMLRFRSPYSAVAIADASGIHLVEDGEWLDTGDKAELATDGRFRLLGRRSEVFKRHGEKISLANLAATLREVWDGSLTFLLEPAPDGEIGHVLVLSPPPAPERLRPLLVTLRERFRRPHWPIRIEAVANMPLSPNGKPDLEALRTQPRAILWKQIL